MPEDKPAKCKFCGEGGLQWHMEDGGWQLMHIETNTPHECPSAARYYANEKQMKEQQKQKVQEHREKEGYL